jgi:hypothetical protein
MTEGSNLSELLRRPSHTGAAAAASQSVHSVVARAAGAGLALAAAVGLQVHPGQAFKSIRVRPSSPSGSLAAVGLKVHPGQIRSQSTAAASLKMSACPLVLSPA